MFYSLMPALVIFLAGITAAGGGLWIAMRQYKKEQESKNRAAEDKQSGMELQKKMLDVSARLGDKTAENQLINLGTRLLSAERGTSAEAYKQLIARVPQLAQDTKLLQERTQNAANANASEYMRICGPMINFVADEFDRAMTAIEASGIDIKSKNYEPHFVMATIDTSAHIVRREAFIRNTNIQLLYTTGSATQSGFTGGRYGILINHATGHTDRIDVVQLPDKQRLADDPSYPIGKDGQPVDALTNQVKAKMREAVQAFLLSAELRNPKL